MLDKKIFMAELVNLDDAVEFNWPVVSVVN